MKKKLLTILLACAMTASLAACGGTSSTGSASADSETAETGADASASVDVDDTEAVEPTGMGVVYTADTVKNDGVMTYEEYDAAELDTEVTIEAYVQATQSWWEDQITVYAEDDEGGYFIYNMACSEEDSYKLTPGAKIKVTGYKSEWSGEVEIIDATFELEDGVYLADPVDVTDVLGKDALIKYQNLYVNFVDMVVEPSTDADGKEAAFLYNWDGSGSQGDDLYFNVSYNGATYTFVVESYLCGADTEVYQAVEALEIGQTLDMTGFLYWYNGPNPHITQIYVTSE